MLGSNRPDVARNNKVAPLTWTNSGAISTASLASCLVARAALKDRKVRGDQVAALAAPAFLFS